MEKSLLTNLIRKEKTYMSSKKDKFQRLLNKRLDTALIKLDLVANLSTNRYECNEDDVKNLLVSLKSKVIHIEELFDKRILLNSKKINK